MICFVLEEEKAAAFNDIFNEEIQTYTTPIRNGVRVHDPMSQKQNDVRQLRENLSTAIAAWFREQLPGVFSSGTLDGKIPTCELITTRQAEPFPADAEREALSSEYLRLLELDYNVDIWHSKRIPGLHFQNSRHARHYSIVSIREQECQAAMGEHYPSKEKRSRLWFLDETMSDMIVAWSILPLLEGYTQQVMKARDAALAGSASRKKTIGAFEAAGDSMLRGFDISAVAIELAEMAREKFWFFLDDPQFRGPSHAPTGSEVSLREQLHRSADDQAVWLQGIERGFREYSAQYGTLLGAKENIRLQKRITWLTVTLVVLAIAAVVVPVLGAKCGLW
ncbi:MAG: hypothetical protein OXG19_00015 [Chloroflexi bacterium]|nr:hypothetical protein [Chloroflexota bacterium]